METTRPKSAKKYADDASGATGAYERKHSYDVSARGEDISTSQDLEEKLEKESLALKEQWAAGFQNEVERQYQAEALRIELAASAENWHASQEAAVATSNLTAQLIAIDGPDLQQTNGHSDSGGLVDFISDGGAMLNDAEGGGIDFVFDQDLLVSALMKEEQALVDIINKLPNEKGCIIGIGECCDREGGLQSTGAGHGGELEGTVKDFVVSSRALICDLKLLCEVGHSGRVDGSLGDGAMPNGAIYAPSEVSSGGVSILANKDEKVKQVEKVGQQEGFDRIAHKGACAKALCMKMPAQENHEALKMANDADTPPKRSVTVDAGERKEHNRKTKNKRSKTMLRKQTCARKRQPPRSGIMVSLGLALAVVAFIIAAIAGIPVPPFLPRHHHANLKAKFELSMFGCEESYEQYADVDVTNDSVSEKHGCTGARFAYASRSISWPFHVITALPYASVTFDPEVRPESGNQCDRQLREKDEMLEEKDKIIIKVKEEALQAVQEQSGMSMVHHSSRVNRGQRTARNARRKFRRPSALISSSLRPLHIPVRMYVEGAVQLWKALPLIVSVDAGSGNNSPSCIPFSAASTSTSASCKTIRYALEHGQIAARSTSSPLELAVSPGVYLGECTEDGSAITIPTAITKAGGRTGAVKIDCEKKGKAFNVTQTPNSTFHLEGLTIANGKSAMGGAAFIEGGHTVLKGCTFDNLESLASSAEGNFVGGGAIMFVVSRLLLDVVYPHSKLINLTTPRFLLLPRPRCNFIYRTAPSTTAALPPVAAVEYWSRSTQWAEDGRQPMRSPSWAAGSTGAAPAPAVERWRRWRRRGWRASPCWSTTPRSTGAGSTQ
jgi:hypothetical protein